MKKTFAIAGLAALIVGALGTTPRAAGAIVGYVSDAKCAMLDSSTKSKAAAEWIKPAAFESCVKDCMKEKDAEAIFVTEDNKILRLDAASKKKIEPFLGHKVSVTGTVQGSTLKVDTVTGLKLQ